MKAFVEPYGYGVWVYKWQSVHAVSAVVGSLLWPEFLASLIQRLPGMVFWLLLLHMDIVSAKTSRGQEALDRKIVQH